MEDDLNSDFIEPIKKLKQNSPQSQHENTKSKRRKGRKHMIAEKNIDEQLNTDLMRRSNKQKENATLEKIGWSYKRPRMQGVKFTINSNCKEKILGQIRERLMDFGESTYKEFTDSCFGHFTNLPEVVGHCNSAIHYVISYEMKFDENRGDPTEISFFINNTRLRFRRFEYALITGLRFGGTDFNPYNIQDIPASSLYTREFNNTKMTVAQLLERFLNKSIRIGEDNIEYVKVAKILFVYHVLFGKDPRNTNVAEWIWVLIEDREAWESFPWGSISYQMLLQYMSRIKTEPAGNKREFYHMFGFSMSFMAWIYCAIPQLGNICGVVHSDIRTPRILRFRYTRSNTEISPVKGQLHSTLEPLPSELNTDYWKSIEPEGTPFKLKYRDRLANQIGQHQPNVAVGRADAIKTQAQEKIASNENQKGPIFSFSSSRKRKIIDDIGENAYDRIRNDDNFVQAIGEYAASRVLAEIGKILPGYLDYMSHQRGMNSKQEKETHGRSHEFKVERNDEEQKALVDGIHGMDDPHWSEEITGTIPYTQFKHIWGPTPECSTPVPVIAAAEIQSIEGCFTPKIDFTVVRRRAPSAILRSPFLHSKKGEADYKAFLNSNNMRNVGVGYNVPAAFFKDMGDTSKELENSHIDSYLACLYKKPEFVGLRKCDPKITITSTAFVSAVNLVWKKYHSDEELTQCDPLIEENIPVEDLHELSKFVTGVFPKWGETKTWFQYEKVIVVVHMPLHWVTCCVNLKECYIMIYDSLQHAYDSCDHEDVMQFFTPLTRILPQVLKYCNFYKVNPSAKPNYMQWKVSYPEEGNAYKQSDSLNCGAYALKYAESILTGRCEQPFKKDDLKQYRTQLAKTVYHFSTDEDTIHEEG